MSGEGRGESRGEAGSQGQAERVLAMPTSPRVVDHPEDESKAVKDAIDAAVQVDTLKYSHFCRIQ